MDGYGIGPGPKPSYMCRDSTQQQYPKEHVPPQAYIQTQQGYSQPVGYQPVPQNNVHHQYADPNAPSGYRTVVVDQPRPTNYMVPAIFACLCCFWPTGICAIVAANNANKAADDGNMEYAHQQSNRARTYLIISIVLGIAWIIAAVIVQTNRYK